MEDLGDVTPEDVAYVENYGDESFYPHPQEKPGIFTFLKRVLGMKDTSKASNLENNELSLVRDYQAAAQFSETWGLDEVGKYLRDESEIVLATALSKKGFLINSATISKKDVKLRGETKPKESKFQWQNKSESGGED